MSNGVDSRGRPLLTKVISSTAQGNPEQFQAIQAVMLVDQEGVPVVFSGGGTSTDHKNYIHTQDAAQDTWIIVHNLDRFPSVTVVDSAGTQGIGDVDYHLTEPDLIGKVITCFFSSAFSGKAFLN